MKNRGGQYTPIVFDGGEFFDLHFLHRVFKIKVNKKRLPNGPMEGINSKIETILKSSNGINNSLIEKQGYLLNQ